VLYEVGLGSEDSLRQKHTSSFKDLRSPLFSQHIPC